MPRRALVLLAALALVLVIPACGGALDGDDPSARLFAPDHVVEVDIRIPPADWDALRMQARTVLDIFGNCLEGPFNDPFTWFRGAVSIDGQVLEDVGVRKKGFLGSLDDNRPSLKLKFDEFVEGRRLAGLKNLTLNNAKQDPSLVHQCLAYRTFTAAGVPASRCNFARVRVNGADLGLYVHVESVNKQFLSRHYSDPDGNLYEGTLSDFRDGWTATFELKTNESQNDRSDLAALVDALEAPDGELLARLSPILDVERFLTFWAVEVLIGHWDGYSGNTNNFYVYHDPATRRFEFLPWGADATFQGGPRPGEKDAPISVMATSLLARRLYLIPSTRDRYLARLRSLLGGLWREDELGAEIDRMQRLLSQAAGPAGSSEVAARLAPVREFVAGRRAQIEAELANGPPTWKAPLRNAPCIKPIGGVTGSIATKWGTVGVPDPLDTGRGTLAGTILGAPLQVVRAGAIAGVDPKATPPGSGPVQLAVVALMQDNTPSVAVFQLDPRRYRANTTVTIDWSSVQGQLYKYNPKIKDFEGIGLFSEGTLELGEAGNTPGAAVTATFKATVSKPPF